RQMRAPRYSAAFREWCASSTPNPSPAASIAPTRVLSAGAIAVPFPLGRHEGHMKVTTFNMLGVVARYSEAAPLLQKPGDCAVVEREGVRRQIVIACPDGCGETLSINLDPRSGAAWRLYQRRGRWSLFPSIDKTAGCRSHFILWGGH